MPESARKGAVAPQGKQQDKPKESADKSSDKPSAPQSNKEPQVTAHRGPHIPEGAPPPGAGVQVITEEVRPEEPTSKATPKPKALKVEDLRETQAAAFNRGLRRESTVAMDSTYPHRQVVEHSRRIDRLSGTVVAVDVEPVPTSEVVSRLRELASKEPGAE